MKIDRGARIDRHDHCSSHEEADILITQHAIALELWGKSVNVCVMTFCAFCSLLQ